MSIARSLSMALDPSRIAVDVGLTLDPWQQELMRSDAPRVLMCCARQTGKSSVAALIALSTAIMEPGALVLLVSPSLRQSSEIFRTVMGFLRRLPDPPEIKSESVLRCELRSGSRIVALPGESDTIRGLSAPQLIVVDEAARCSDDLMQSVRPMLATSKNGGRLIALSTPKGVTGFFHDAWHGDPSWHRVRVPASECPRISQEFLDEQLRELGEQRFAEEFGLAFLQDGDVVIKQEFFDRAISKDVSVLEI